MLIVDRFAFPLCSENFHLFDSLLGIPSKNLYFTIFHSTQAKRIVCCGNERNQWECCAKIRHNAHLPPRMGLLNTLEQFAAPEKPYSGMTQAFMRQLRDKLQRELAPPAANVTQDFGIIA